MMSFQAVILCGFALTAAPADSLRWHEDLKEARSIAERDGRPLLVRFESDDCVWCRKLDKELVDEGVRRELADWTLVSLNVEKFHSDARMMTVTAVPALRVLAADGRQVAAHDGFLPAGELKKWLAKSRGKTTNAPSNELLSKDEPDVLQVIKLVKSLGDRDPLTRESATRRLRPFPSTSARAVVERFADGSLQTRLGTFELLESWGAPLTSMDPWLPETITKESLNRLREWSSKVAGDDKAKTSLRSPIRDREELDRLTRVDDAEANAIRERLAQGGDELKREVLARLKNATTDKERERLLALRYRMAASDSLSLRWPGGLTRLSATSTPVRQRAVQELVERVSVEDEGLLLELFSDPDPLVRETTLRALQGVAGEKASESLIKLLDDPDPNVRAAVLKQFAEAPVPAMSKALSDFAAKESDPDLLVHAVRAMSGLGDKKTITTLRGLLKNDHWRVRAEAVDALGKPDSRAKNCRDDLPAEVAADLAARLDDADDFVAGRAAASLIAGDPKTLEKPEIDALISLASKRPSLTPEVLRWFSMYKAPARVVEKIKPFLANKDDKIRAAAVSAVSDLDDKAAESVITAGLKDQSTEVRVAAARQIVAILDTKRKKQSPPGVQELREQLVVEWGPGRVWLVLPKKDDNAVSSQAARLERVKKAGSTHWIPSLRPSLEKMLASSDESDRTSAALALSAMGIETPALDVLAAAATSDPSRIVEIAPALRFLDWPARKNFFQRLTPLARNIDGYLALLRNLAVDQDPRALSVTWSAADQPLFLDRSLGGLLELLVEAHFGNNRYQRDKLDPAQRKQAISAAVRATQSSGVNGRLIGYSILSSLDFDAASPKLSAIIDDEKQSESMRRQALLLYLVYAPDKEARKRAIKAFKSSALACRRLGLRYFADGPTGLRMDDDRGLLMNNWAIDGSFFSADVRNSQSLDLPKELTLEKVLPFLSDSDPMTAARAGYLAALGGDARGIDILLRAWKGGRDKDDPLNRLVYRAIAAIDEEVYVPHLERVYALLRSEKWQAQAMYWTIRDMEAHGAVKLRKRMRADGVLVDQ